MTTTDGAFSRIGRWCFRQRWGVLAVGFAVCVAGFVAAPAVHGRVIHDTSPPQAESTRGRVLLESGRGSSGRVVGLVDGVDPAAPRVRDAVTRAAEDVARRSGVREVRSPYTPGLSTTDAGAYLAGDRRALLVVATLSELPQQRRDAAIDAISARLAELGEELRGAGQPRAQVRVGGEPVIELMADRHVHADIHRADALSIPVALVVLMIVLSGIAAGALPVVMAAVAQFLAFCMMLGFTTVTALDSGGVVVVVLLGIGLAIDYGLLLIGRYREELAAGFAAEEAVGRTWATAGRTVFFSGLTIAGVLSGLLMFDAPGLFAFGLAGVSTAVTTVLVALTVTAGLLGVAHRRIRPAESSRHQVQPRHGAPEVGFFTRLGELVQRRPLLVALLTGAALLAAGAPLLGTTFKVPGLSELPRSLESARVADDLASRFGQPQTPLLTVVARGEPAALDAWALRWNDDPAVARVRPAEPVGAGVSTVELELRGAAQDTAAQDLVRRVRDARPDGAESFVTGEAASLVDLTAIVVDGLPYAVGLALVTMLLMLFAMTGSLVIPVKAALANVVTLGATVGVMNLVFVQGWGAGLLGTLTVDGLDPTVLIIVFAFAFGLALDYEVFLLGRITEYVGLGDDTDTAVRRGLQHTGRLITSAALLILIVFAGQAAAQMGTVEQLGLGLAVAVAVDATVVRCLLVPATMTIMGRWNWWAPGVLRRLHERIGLRERPLPQPVEAGS